jgi:protein-tyrosine phosphatase
MANGPSTAGAVAEQDTAKPVAFPRPDLPSWMGVRGFVDIHCHLLPGIDDGPAQPDIAVQMAIGAYHAGTLAMIATPHCSFRFPFDPNQAAERLQSLESHVPGDLLLFGGCEMQLSDESLRAFEENPTDYTLNRSRYVLVELLPQSAPASVEQVLARFQERGYVPVLAHPERYPVFYSDSERLLEWVRQGCLMQITADSLTGRMGRRARNLAVAMIRDGWAHFVASDAHDPVKRPPHLLEGFRCVAELAGADCAARLFTHNPLALLHDEPIG